MYSVGMMIRGTMYPKKGHFIYKFVKVGGGGMCPLCPPAPTAMVLMNTCSIYCLVVDRSKSYSIQSYL